MCVGGRMEAEHWIKDGRKRDNLVEREDAENAI